jgi:spore germination protein YaaH
MSTAKKYTSTPFADRGVSLASPASAWGYSSYAVLSGGLPNGIYITGVTFCPDVTDTSLAVDTTAEVLIELYKGDSNTLIAQIPAAYRIDSRVAHVQPRFLNLQEPIFVQGGQQITCRIANSINAVMDAQNSIKLAYYENTQPTVALNSPSDSATVTDTTPDLSFTGTDPEGEDVTYNVEVVKDNPNLAMGWAFPDNSIDPTSHITGNNWDTLSAMWYELDSSGVLVKRDSSSFGSNFFYTTTNATLVKDNCRIALVNVSSGNDTAVNALVGDSTKRTNFVNELVTFCTDNDFHGVDMDLETFQVGIMTQAQYDNWKLLVIELGDALHAEGLILTVEVPPVWNSSRNNESGAGDEWDVANSRGYYRLRYEDFNVLPVDKVVIMAYDYQYDYSAGTPNQPLKWLREILAYAKANIKTATIVAGLPSAGYSGGTGGYSITGRTYDFLSVQTGFGGASRDSASGELIWANGGTSYAAIDDTAIDLKVAEVNDAGIYEYALWHVGQNKYGSNFGEFALNAKSASDGGFSGSPDNSDPFASAQAVTYTVPSALADDTYFWRVRGKDPAGSNTWGEWSEVREFEMSGSTPSTPTKIKISGVFVGVTPKVKIGGTFVNKTSKIKIGGVFV